MTDTLYADLADLQVDDVDGIATLFERTPQLAELKYKSVADYERLRASWKAKGVPRLPQLDKAVELHLKAVLARQAQAETLDDDGFVRNSKGLIVSNPDNIRLAIAKLGAVLSYDSFRGWPKVEGLPAGFGPSLDDASLDRLWLMLDTKFGYRPNRALFDTVVSDLCMQNRFHPVLEYLDSLVWDGVPRIDSWLVTYAKADDSAYVRAVGALVLIASVRRVRQPGVKFDEMLILESAEQGYQKSTLIEAMAVKEDWFSDSVPLNADDKTMIERSSGKWICEIGELQGMRKGEVERIRAQLSRRTDRARLAYARLPVEIPRQSILIGSTNADRSAPYLADINGNRRFWPVEVGRCDVAGFIRDRDQLWAEAATREAAGESIRLDESLWPAAAKEQSARAVGNAFEDVLGRYLGDKEGLIWADDAWRLLGIAVERRDTQAGKFGKAMKALGWERSNRRRGGVQTWAYVKGGSSRQLVVTEDRFDRGFALGYAHDAADAGREATTEQEDF